MVNDDSGRPPDVGELAGSTETDLKMQYVRRFFFDQSDDDG